MNFDFAKFGSEVARAVTELIAPLRRRVEALEDASGGKAHAQLVERVLALELIARPLPPTAEEVARALRETTLEALKAFAAPELQAAVEKSLQRVETRLAEVKDGRDGADGKPGADGRDGKDGADGKPGADGRDGKDGAAGKSFTAEDAAPTLLAAVDRWALDFERRAVDLLQRSIDRIPAPKDGADGKPGADGRDGKDGADGLSADDFTIEYDGVRTFSFRLQRGPIDKAWEFALPIVLDCGVYTETRTYAPGDGVTWGGSFWIAQRATQQKPDTPDSGWRLAVKRGRDGKDSAKAAERAAARPVEYRV